MNGKQRDVFRHVLFVVSATSCLWLASGCAPSYALVDWTGTYHLNGRLIHAHDGSPVVGASVVVYKNYEDRDVDPPPWIWEERMVVTDDSGCFSAPIYVLMGGTYLICMIPKGSDECPPGPCESFAVYIGVDGQWQKRIIPVSPSQQSVVKGDDRWVELGDIPYDPNGPTVTTQPAVD